MAKLAVGDGVRFVKNMVKTDTTTNRVKAFVVQGAPKLPAATGRYLLDKVPIVQWLPRYHPAWLLQDFIAGLTIGVMLIPQGLAYAKIATIPIENGLYSSWLPAAICVFMGTSKGELTNSRECRSTVVEMLVHQCRLINGSHFNLGSLDGRDYRRLVR
jgi:sodium-independent sulfate anion transporter 11